MRADLAEAIKDARDRIEEHRGALKCIARALKGGRLSPEDIECVRDYPEGLPDLPAVVELRLKIKQSEVLNRLAHCWDTRERAALNAAHKAVSAELRSAKPLDDKMLRAMTEGDLNRFVVEHCVLADWASVNISLLYVAFITWAAEQGASRFTTLTKFSLSVKRSGRFKKVRYADGVYYRGLGLTADAPATTNQQGSNTNAGNAAGAAGED